MSTIAEFLYLAIVSYDIIRAFEIWHSNAVQILWLGSKLKLGIY